MTSIDPSPRHLSTLTRHLPTVARHTTTGCRRRRPLPRRTVRQLASLGAFTALTAWSLPGTSIGVARLEAQVPVEGEVRQLVTFTFLPGRAPEAVAVFRDQAMPLYEDNAPMLSFRGFREVESPTPLDLIVVSSFEGMRGMDASNESLRKLADDGGTSIGAIYGDIAALSTGHRDEFVEMIPSMGSGDPSTTRLTAMVRYRVRPEEREGFERLLSTRIAPWERDQGIPGATGRFLVSDGWHYLRILGFDSLGDYQDYWDRIAREAGYDALASLTLHRREVIVAAVPELAVR